MIDAEYIIAICELNLNLEHVSADQLLKPEDLTDEDIKYFLDEEFDIGCRYTDPTDEDSIPEDFEGYHTDRRELLLSPFYNNVWSRKFSNNLPSN